MVLNYIWIGFFVVGFLVALIRVIGFYYRDELYTMFNLVFDKSDWQVIGNISNSLFQMAETSVMSVALPLAGTMAFWLGIMKIGEMGGAVGLLSKAINPFFSKIFPDIPKNHPASGAMMMNFAANMLGLDNSATPLGLKAMDHLQELNPQKDTASNSQIMFLVLNTSGLTLIPVSVMALRAGAGAANPSDIFLPILFATFFSSMAGLIIVSLIQKINLFNKIVLAYLGGVSLLVASFIFFFVRLTAIQQQSYSSVLTGIVLLFIIVSFLALGARKKLNLFEVFVDGAKEGFQVAVKIIPYLVAMLVAIAVFRASGAMDFVLSGIRYVVGWFTSETAFVDALPTALMKPLSGSGARGMMVETMNNYGADSFAARLAATFQGSTETTFYVLAVYFGAVGIKKIRYALTAGLLADLAGIIASIIIAYMFWG
jgi:spore maturation protein SpmA